MRVMLAQLIGAAALLLTANSAVAQSCYESSITSPTPFMGNNGEIFKLMDGSVWEVKYEYEYLYAYYPAVVVCPSSEKLLVDGKKLRIERIAAAGAGPGRAFTRPTSEPVIESRVDGEFEGWEGETIVKLANGQVWEQSEYYYRYRYAYRPEVLIYRSGGRYKMLVEGIDKAVRVVRLE